MPARLAHFTAAVVIWAQVPKQAPVRVGNGVTAPSILSKVEPEYSPQAREIGLQGRALLSIVINELGRLENIEVVSPLGFGLDERAIRDPRCGAMGLQAGHQGGYACPRVCHGSR